MTVSGDVGLCSLSGGTELRLDGGAEGRGMRYRHGAGKWQAKPDHSLEPSGPSVAGHKVMAPRD